MNRYLLLDRDGTIIEDRHYLADPTEIRFLPGAIKGLQMMKELGFKLVIITNQSGIGRGYFSMATLYAIHKRLSDLLLKEGIRIEAIYFCPHHPDNRCLCRKPLPGLVYQAASDLEFDPRHSIMIGDSAVDIGLAKAVSAYSIIVRTGNGRETEMMSGIKPDAVVDTLLEAAEHIKSLDKGE